MPAAGLCGLPACTTAHQISTTTSTGALGAWLLLAMACRWAAVHSHWQAHPASVLNPPSALCSNTLPTQIRVARAFGGGGEARQALLRTRLLSFYVAFQSNPSPTGGQAESRFLSCRWDGKPLFGHCLG